MGKKSLRQQTWEKSGGVCCLCGLPMQLGIIGPLAFTIEHLTPRSRGGPNSIENLDGSHSWCNQYKDGSTMEELPKGVRRFLRWKIKNFLIHQKVPTLKE